MVHNLRENNNEDDYRKIIIKGCGEQGSICAGPSIVVVELTLIICADA